MLYPAKRGRIQVPTGLHDIYRKIMGRYILKRLWHGVIVIFGVTVIVFVVTRMVGDPVKVMLPLEATLEQRAAFEKRLGLDRPIPIQFAEFMGDIARLEFGDSLWQHRPAMEIVFEKLPLTLALAFLGIGLAFILSIPLGIISALKPGGLSDRGTVFVSLIGLSVPQFWLGLLLIVVFAVQLHWLPTSGIGSPANIILPAITMALPALARMVMIVRSSMIDELNQQYVKTGFAKGLPFYRVVGIHALRNAALPVVTLGGWELIRAVAGYSVVVETVFAWPGLGMTAIQAIEREDLILLQAIVFTVAITVVLINILMDMAYTVIDPRLKLA
jgi:peptide/nickel transport system permease protein